MNLQQWIDRIHDMAKAKGWWEVTSKSLSVSEKMSKLMLIVGEISEASEEVRKGTPIVYWNTPTGMVTLQDTGGGFNLRVGDELMKPEGEAVELADAMIRIMDYAGFRGWPLEKIIAMKVEYNATRPFRHGGKLA